MKIELRGRLLVTGTLAWLLGYCPSAAQSQERRAFFQPVPTVQLGDAAQQAQVSLGKKLFSDPILSKDRTISCNSCHNLATAGVDNEPTSPGVGGHRGTRNSPTVYNAAVHVAQFWDGRAKDVEEQALGPVLNPGEMAMPDAAAVEARLRADQTYREAFKKAFPQDAEPVTFANMGKAIGAFERTLLTPSRFDDFLQGREDALTDAEKKGLDKFISTGCIACHNGVGVGGGMFQKLGLVQPYKTTDEGRFQVTHAEADKFVFKVPSLRHVDKTGPYFHDGSITSLDTAVDLMAKHQLGKTLSPEDRAEIVTFLRSLSPK
jgi:cytochrome c peroxidase